MRTKYSILNTIYATLANIVTFVFLFISQTLFIKILGIEYSGMNGLFSSILTILSLLELGIGNAIVYKLYKYISLDDKETIKSLMQFYKKAYNIICAVIFIAGLIFIPFLHIIVDKEIPNNINIYIVYLLFLLSTISTYVLAYKRSILFANQKNYIISIIHIFYIIILNILQLLIIYFTKNYYLYLIVKILCILLENIIIYIKSNHDYPYLLDKDTKELDSNIKNEIITKIKALFLHKIGGTITFSGDNIIISTFLGLKYVGMYANYHYIIYAVSTFFQSIIASTTASVGNLLTYNNIDKRYLVFKKIIFLNLWISIFTSTCLFILTEPFINIWLGEGYLLSKFTLILLIVDFFQNMMRTTFLLFKDTAGIWVEDKLIPVFRSILNIVLSIILLKIMGLPGVFLATIISAILIWGYSFPKYVYKGLLERTYKEYIIKIIQTIILALVIVSSTYLITNMIVIDNVYISFIVKMLLCLFLPNMMMYIGYRDSNEFKYYVDLFFKRNKNKLQIIILAGGLGTRLKDKTKDIPKSMIDVDGRPFLDYLLDNISKYNVDKVVLAVSYKKEVIKEHYKNKYKNIKIEYSEDDLLGTGGAIKMALNKCDASNVIIINGDVYQDINYDDLYNKYKQNKCDYMMVVKPMKKIDRFGTVSVSDNNITNFKEKVYVEDGLINTGIHIINKKILDGFNVGDKFSLEKDFLIDNINKINNSYYLYQGEFIDIGIPEDYLRVQQLIKSFKTSNNITVFGLGFVGITTGLYFAERKNLKVYGIDINKERKDQIRNNILPFYEPKLEELLKKHNNKNFIISEDYIKSINESNYIFVCVDTNMQDDGSVDLRSVTKVLDDILNNIDTSVYRTIIIKSSVPPTTANEHIVPIINKHKFKIGVDIGFSISPEFLREGQCYEEIINPTRVLIGCNDEQSKEAMNRLYYEDSIKIFNVNYQTAEFSKYLSNSLLGELISFSNEMSMVADSIGDINTKEAFEIIRNDKRWDNCEMRHYVHPIGKYGGYCLVKDINALYKVSLKHKYDSKFLKTTMAINNVLVDYFVQGIVDKVPKNKTIGVLGLSFKPESDDVRNASSYNMIKKLKDEGYKKIYAHDPIAIDSFKRSYKILPDSRFIRSYEEILDKADVLVVVIIWKDYKNIKNETDKLVFDFTHKI